MPPLTPKGGIFLHLTSHSLVENTAQWKITGDRLCIVAESWVESKTKTQKTALGQSGMLRIWRCDCALCPKDKNRSPFHGEKTPDNKKFPGRRLNQISQMILHGRDAILRVRVK